MKLNGFTHRLCSVTGGEQRNRGFTLLEVLISITLMTILTAPLLVAFYDSQAIFRAQSQQGEVVQQMRIAMDQIVRTIRQAGNDPTEAGFDVVNIMGDGQVQLFSDITGSEASQTGIAAEATGDPDGDTSEIFENVTFRFSQNEERIYADVGYGEEILAENISDLNFTYYTLDGTTTANPNDVARVEVEMIGNTEDPDLRTGQNYSITLRSEVFIRSRTPQILP